MRFDEVQEVNNDYKRDKFGGEYGQKEGEKADQPKNSIENKWLIQVGPMRTQGSEDHPPLLDIVNPGGGNPHLDDGGE